MALVDKGMGKAFRLLEYGLVKISTVVLEATMRVLVLLDYKMSCNLPQADHEYQRQLNGVTIQLQTIDLPVDGAIQLLQSHQHTLAKIVQLNLEERLLIMLDQGFILDNQNLVYGIHLPLTTSFLGW